MNEHKKLEVQHILKTDRLVNFLDENKIPVVMTNTARQTTDEDVLLSLN